MRISDWSSDVCSSDLAQGLYRNRLDGTVEKPKQLVRQPARFVPIADFVSYPALMHAPSPTHARSYRPLQSLSHLTAWNEDRTDSGEQQRTALQDCGSCRADRKSVV